MENAFLKTNSFFSPSVFVVLPPPSYPSLPTYLLIRNTCAVKKIGLVVVVVERER
jgi:hypothetical protein